MKKSKESITSPQGHQHEKANRQPASVRNDEPGYGDKKLEGPNRPAT
jgi:hypothetical protein